MSVAHRFVCKDKARCKIPESALPDLCQNKNTICKNTKHESGFEIWIFRQKFHFFALKNPILCPNLSNIILDLI